MLLTTVQVAFYWFYFYINLNCLHMICTFCFKCSCFFTVFDQRYILNICNKLFTNLYQSSCLVFFLFYFLFFSSAQHLFSNLYIVYNKWIVNMNVLFFFLVHLQLNMITPATVVAFSLPVTKHNFVCIPFSPELLCKHYKWL